MILGETLDKALNRARARRQSLEVENKLQVMGALQYLDKQANEPKSWGISRHLSDCMEETGWCKKEIRRAQLTMGDVSSVYFAQLFPRSSPNQGQHKDCTFFECVVTPPGVQDVQHTDICITRTQKEEYYQCPREKPDPAKITQIIKDNKIPLLQFVGGPNLEIIEYTPLDPGSTESLDSQPVFGAVSHVWSDGLGHDHGYGLPRCQLVRIRDAFRRVPRTNLSDSEQSQDMPFWIDTLCIPTQWEIRKKAIPDIRKVYECAGAVVVLDPEYLGTSSQMPTLEAVVRINTGRWMQRLWTLQEGVLSKNLFFEFKGGLLSLSELEKLYSAAKYGGLNDDYHHVYRAGWLFSPAMQSLQKSETANQVAKLWRSSQWRIASHPTDETICLATLLGLDLAPLLEITPDPSKKSEILQKLMVTFLYHLDRDIGIPSGTIFLPGPKLDQDGYRWAPKTWLFEQPREVLYPLFVNEAKAAFLTLRGLHVQYPGIEIHPPKDPLKFSRFWIPVSRNLNEWYRVDDIDEGRGGSWDSK